MKRKEDPSHFYFISGTKVESRERDPVSISAIPNTKTLPTEPPLQRSVQSKEIVVESVTENNFDKALRRAKEIQTRLSSTHGEKR